ACERRGGGLVRAWDGIAVCNVDWRDTAGLDGVGLQGQHPRRITEPLSSKISEALRHRSCRTPIRLDQNQVGLCFWRCNRKGDTNCKRCERFEREHPEPLMRIPIITDKILAI